MHCQMWLVSCIFFVMAASLSSNRGSVWDETLWRPISCLVVQVLNYLADVDHDYYPLLMYLSVSLSVCVCIVIGSLTEL